MSKKHIETSEVLVRRLAGALVSWLTFQQAAKRSAMYNEYYMYTTIFELASARGWKAVPQFPCKIAESNRRLDFIFYKRAKNCSDAEIAVLELSYISSDKSNWKLDKLRKDKDKLIALKALVGFKGKLRRYIMVAGKENHLREYCRKNFRQAIGVFEKVPKGGWLYKSSIKFQASDDEDSGGPYSTRWCVMVIYVSGREAAI